VQNALGPASVRLWRKCVDRTVTTRASAVVGCAVENAGRVKDHAADLGSIAILTASKTVNYALGPASIRVLRQLENAATSISAAVLCGAIQIAAVVKGQPGPGGGSVAAAG